MGEIAEAAESAREGLRAASRAGDASSQRATSDERGVSQAADFASQPLGALLAWVLAQWRRSDSRETRAEAPQSPEARRGSGPRVRGSVMTDRAGTRAPHRCPRNALESCLAPRRARRQTSVLATWMYEDMWV